MHAISCCIFFFFFFQAEDGIRDTSVTGVQTCALPIARRSAEVGDRRGTENPPDQVDQALTQRAVGHASGSLVHGHHHHTCAWTAVTAAAFAFASSASQLRYIARAAGRQLLCAPAAAA